MHCSPSPQLRRNALDRETDMTLIWSPGRTLTFGFVFLLLSLYASAEGEINHCPRQHTLIKTVSVSVCVSVCLIGKRLNMHKCHTHTESVQITLYTNDPHLGKSFFFSFRVVVLVNL